MDLDKSSFYSIRISNTKTNRVQFSVLVTISKPLSIENKDKIRIECKTRFRFVINSSIKRCVYFENLVAKQIWNSLNSGCKPIKHGQNHLINTPYNLKKIKKNFIYVCNYFNNLSCMKVTGKWICTKSGENIIYDFPTYYNVIIK
jgi:hypothetical protein